MYEYNGVSVLCEGEYYVTKGLFGMFGYEIMIKSGKHEEDKYRELIVYLLDYLLEGKVVIKSNETIAYYSWMLKFEINDGQCVIMEFEKNGNGWVDGVEYAIELKMNQKDICEKWNVEPQFPIFNQFISISDGVLEGFPIDASRYLADEDMTGWYFVTGLYNGDYKEMKNIHYYHLAFKRPELMKYMALPSGFTLFQNSNEIEIEFSENLLKE